LVVSCEDFVDEKRLAVRYGLARRTWQTLRQRGEGPTYVKVGRRVLYRISDVEVWLSSHIVKPKEHQND
jgi:predicted DNA-binding transcriptional regulator AlpA